MLGSAERFLLGLISVPYYETRINSMLLKSEFAEAMQIIKPGLNALVKATSGMFYASLICFGVLPSRGTKHRVQKIPTLGGC